MGQGLLSLKDVFGKQGHSAVVSTVSQQEGPWSKDTQVYF